MRMRRRTRWEYPSLTCGRLLAGLLLLSAAAGCNLPRLAQPSSPQPAAQDTSEIADADTGFTLIRADQADNLTLESPRLVYELAVLHVLIPREKEAAMEKVWNFLREDALDAETRLRLGQNGIRVGVGHAQWWDPIKAALDAIEDHRVTFATPIRVPVGFPLSLELDSEPRDQTLFCVGRDGILSGSTWPESRNVLRVAYAPDPRDADRILLQAVPEVHQKRDGWEWVRTESGLWQVPKQSMQSFDAAGFFVTLDPDEFVLIAPSANSGIYGLLGGAFLTRESEGQYYNSYVFLRPEARHVGQHD
jgi:hypothetical protein